MSPEAKRKSVTDLMLQLSQVATRYEDPCIYELIVHTYCTGCDAVGKATHEYDPTSISETGAAIEWLVLMENLGFRDLRVLVYLDDEDDLEPPELVQ